MRGFWKNASKLVAASVQAAGGKSALVILRKTGFSLLILKPGSRIIFGIYLKGKA
jgi:hypothetical protein